jgi:hypothetical protein
VAGGTSAAGFDGAIEQGARWVCEAVMGIQMLKKLDPARDDAARLDQP